MQNGDITSHNGEPVGACWNYDFPMRISVGALICTNVCTKEGAEQKATPPLGIPNPGRNDNGDITLQ
jgi:hypothetical protein